MGTSENGISKTSEGAARPSLLSPGTSAGSHNILDAMANRQAISSPPRKPLKLIWLLLPLMAAAAWGISTQWKKPPAQASTTELTATVVAPPKQPIVAAEASQPKSAGGAQVNTSQADAVAQPAGSARPAAVQEPAPFDLQAALNAPNPVSATAASTPATPAQAKPPPAPNQSPKVAAVSPSNPKPPAATHAPAAAAKPAPKADSTQRVSSKPEPTAAQKPATADPDVELLNAIMKHLGDEKGATGAARSPQTIAELVKSCRELDAIEAMLCRRRICEGSWGKAQACPMELAPKSTTRAAAAPSTN